MLEAEVDKRLFEALQLYFKSNRGAYEWVIGFKDLCHSIDDLVDIPERHGDTAYFGLVCNQFVEILSADFYTIHKTKLYAIVKTCLHQFFHSAEWERSDAHEWHKKWADVVRCCYNQMVVAVTEIVVLEESGSIKGAYEAAQEVSRLIVMKSYYHHHLENGKPI